MGNFSAEFLWAIVVATVLYLLLTDRTNSPKWESWIPAIFFLSGFPALIYQIVWQRALFALFGSDIQSVTIIVTTFIFGLGLGSLLSGRLSARISSPLIFFGILEISIGFFGAISLPTFQRLSSSLAGLSDKGAATVVVVVLLVPTMLMGATLPMLVAHLSRKDPVYVGVTVGRLYFANTLGSAIACFICAQFAMRVLGESRTVLSASILNLTIGSLTLASALRGGSQLANLPPKGDLPTNKAWQFRYPVALLLAGFSGFIALAYELLWFRLYSFSDGGHAPAFAYLLGAYLVGLAYGSLIAEKRCRDDNHQTKILGLGTIGLLVILFNILAFLIAPLLALVSTGLGPSAVLPFIAVAAAALGSIFPLLANSSISPGHGAGKGLGGLYFTNMLGAAGGSLAVGYLLTNSFGVQPLALGLLLGGLSVGATTIAASGKKISALAMFIVLAAILFPLSRSLYKDIYEKMLFKESFQFGMKFAHVVENRNGVITVTKDGTVYGGGVFDGRFNIDPLVDSNNIVRCYALSSFHPSPRRVLLIGLSSGSWAQVLANHPQIEQLQIVEINPGYLQLIPRYSEVKSLLSNPRVKITIDDGRRWLRRNPSTRFDVVVMNTTYYWRSNSTNLLSVEFLNLIRSHLNPGGIFYYNTTSSPEAQLTAVTVFPFGLRVANFVAVSDSPIILDLEHLRQTLEAYRIDGRRVLDLTREDQRRRREEIVSIMQPVAYGEDQKFMSSEFADSIRQRFRGKQIVTDDNMVTEW